MKLIIELNCKSNKKLASHLADIILALGSGFEGGSYNTELGKGSWKLEENN